MFLATTPRRRGFTFIEIMFVVVIIGILLALVGPSLGGRITTARTETTRAQLEHIKTAIKQFEIDTGSYPKRLEELVEESPEFADSWKGPYLDSDVVPPDAWKQPFEYKAPGQNNKKAFDLWSRGPDKQSGTGDDIRNWTAGT